MKKLIGIFAALVFSAATPAQEINYIVTGARTGSVVLAAQLLEKDAQADLLGGVKLNLSIPGDACKAFSMVVDSQFKETFVTHSDNLYNATAELKRNPLCPIPDFSRAVPVVTEIQGLFLVMPASMDVKSLHTSKLKTGYAFDNPLYRAWHTQLNQAFGQDHTFVGYNGSGSLITGLVSGEIDVSWLTWSSVVQINAAALRKFQVVYQTVHNQNNNMIPVIGDKLKNPALSRAFVSSFWIFNDKNDLAAKLRKNMKELNDSGSGLYGAWTKKANKIFIYDIAEQKKALQNQTWLTHR